jgi:hypothetical protein
LYDQGLQYRTINTVRSTLSSTLPKYDGYLVGQHPLITRLMKGIFNSRPVVPKLFPAWSVKTVLLTLAAWSPANSSTKLNQAELSLSCAEFCFLKDRFLA